MLFEHYTDKKYGSSLSMHGDRIPDFHKSPESFMLKYLKCHYRHLAVKFSSITKPAPPSLSLCAYGLEDVCPKHLKMLPAETPGGQAHHLLLPQSLPAPAVLVRHFTCGPRQSLVLLVAVCLWYKKVLKKHCKKNS